MLKAFNDSAPKGGKRKVVRREAVAVLSQGTLVDASMLAAHPHAAYVAAVAELPPGDGNAGGARVGVCAVEVAEGRVLVGQFEDGPLRSTLQRCLTGAACRIHRIARVAAQGPQRQVPTVPVVPQRASSNVQSCE